VLRLQCINPSPISHQVLLCCATSIFATSDSRGVLDIRLIRCGYFFIRNCLERISLPMDRTIEQEQAYQQLAASFENVDSRCFLRGKCGQVDMPNPRRNSKHEEKRRMRPTEFHALQKLFHELLFLKKSPTASDSMWRFPYAFTCTHHAPF